MKILDLPTLDRDLPEKGDLSDFISRIGKKAKGKLIGALASLPEFKRQAPTETFDLDREKKRLKGKSQQKILAELARDLDLWHAPGGEVFGSFQIGNHLEHWPIRSPGTKGTLRLRFFDLVGKPPSAQAMKETIDLLEARAEKAPEREIHLRIAGEDGRIYIDLCDEHWRAIERAKKGWKILKQSPIRFRRSKSMLTLTDPDQKGSLDPLWRLLNIEVKDRVLLASWLLFALRPHGPYPILILQEPEGRAKSSLARICQRLIDPSAARLRCPPRREEDLFVAIKQSHLIALDNIRALPGWLSDRVCSIATEGTYAKRKLYKDWDEEVFGASRPIILNGPPGIELASDLMDRALLLNLPEIPEQLRREEQSIRREFEREYPSILVGLLNGISGALRDINSIRLSSLPRMADFAKFSSAAERHLGFKRGEFERAYSTNRSNAMFDALENEPLVIGIATILRARKHWEGTATDLLAQMESEIEDRIRKLRDFPKAPNQLMRKLRPLQTALGKIGFDVEFIQQHRGKRDRQSRALTQTPR